MWPATRKLALRDKFLIALFMDNIAGEADTNLYKRLIDSKTREADIGAKGVDGYVDDGQGNPVMVTFRDMPVSKMNDADLSALRGKVLDEFAKIAAYPDGSPELAQFQQRLKSRIAETRRSLAKLVNSPPGFGFRGGDTSWLERLYELNKEPGFRKTVTSKDDLAAIEKSISGSHNIWHEYLTEWQILGTVPYIEAAKPNPALVRQAAEERAARAAAETARLRQQYGAASDRQALERYRADYDAATKAIEEAEKKAASAKFVEHPPMTLDDALEFKTSKLARGVPLVSSEFESMTSATTGIALRLDSVPEDRLVYVSLLPELLMNSGVIEDGKAVSYEDMSQRLRNEILSLDAGFSVNAATDRDELVMRGAGNNAAESRRAIEWMELALYHPNWRMENLPRLRDYVDQALGRLRRTMQGAEENWVRNPETAYRKQDESADAGELVVSDARAQCATAALDVEGRRLGRSVRFPDGAGRGRGIERGAQSDPGGDPRWKICGPREASRNGQTFRQGARHWQWKPRAIWRRRWETFRIPLLRRIGAISAARWRAICGRGRNALWRFWMK